MAKKPVRPLCRCQSLESPTPQTLPCLPGLAVVFVMRLS